MRLSGARTREAGKRRAAGSRSAGHPPRSAEPAPADLVAHRPSDFRASSRAPELAKRLSAIRTPIALRLRDLFGIVVALHHLVGRRSGIMLRLRGGIFWEWLFRRLWRKRVLIRPRRDQRRRRKRPRTRRSHHSYRRSFPSYAVKTVHPCPSRPFAIQLRLCLWRAVGD